MLTNFCPITRRFAETNVAMMLTLLRAAGFRLRAADPVSMKGFVLAVHARAAEAAAVGEMSTRAEVPLCHARVNTVPRNWMPAGGPVDSDQNEYNSLGTVSSRRLVCKACQG